MSSIDLLKGYRESRARLRDEEGLLQVHRELLEFFDKPRCVSFDDMAIKLGYDKSTLSRRTKDLVEMGKLKRTRFTHVWGKPNQYEVIRNEQHRC